MGCFTSRHFVVNPAIKGQDAIAAEVFKRLNLQGKDLDRLYSAFCDIDIDDSGFVQKVEFYSYFKINASALYDKIFGMFDADGSGYLSFMEFVCAMWNFCSMAPENLGSFAFYLFDDDHSGVLDFKEIRRLIEVIHRKSMDENPEIYNLVEKIKESYVVMKVEDFNKCISEKPTLVSPLLAMQFSLRRMLIGEGYWKRISAVRALVPEQQQQEFIMTVEDDAQKILNRLKFERQEAKRKAEQDEQIDRINRRQAGKNDMDKARTEHLLDFYSMSEKDKKKRDTTMSKPKFTTNAYMETGPPEEEEPQKKKKKKKKSSKSNEGSQDSHRPSRLTIDHGEELAPLKVRSKTLSPTYSNVSDTSAASGSAKRHSRKTIVPTALDETKEEAPKRTSSRKTLIEKSASTGNAERGSRKTLVQKSPTSTVEMNSAEQRRAARKTYIAKTTSADNAADTTRRSRNTIAAVDDPDTLLLPKHHRRDDQVVTTDKKHRKSRKQSSAARELPPVIASKKFQED